MYRMSNTLPSLAFACVAALSLAACNDSPNAPSNSDAGGVAAEAGPNGETLKVQPPTVVAPANDLRLDSRRPVMTVNNVAGKFVGGNYSYEFQLLTDGNSTIASTTLPAGSGTTTWTYPADLERDTPYRWRARARLGEAVGPWSGNARFLTVFEKRSPDPAPGTRLPYPNYLHIVHQVAQQNPGILANPRSCQHSEYGGDPVRGWEFMDKLLDALRLEDTRFGYNCKRGNCGDPSHDVIAYHYGSGPDEGNADVYIIDVLGLHCLAATPVWTDVTAVTLNSGTLGRFTSRGRW